MNPFLNERSRFLILWIIVNLIAIFAGTLITFSLYAKLGINNISLANNWLQLIRNLAICGAIQGFIFAGLRTVVLFWAKLRVIPWLLTDVSAMTVGIVLPIIYGTITDSVANIDRSFDNYVIVSWAWSWILTGIAEGLVIGKNRTQKLIWSLINGIAYLFWGFGAVMAIISLGAVLDREVSFLTSISILFLITLILGIGAWLNSYLFLGLLRLQRSRRS